MLQLDLNTKTRDARHDDFSEGRPHEGPVRRNLAALLRCAAISSLAVVSLPSAVYAQQAGETAPPADEMSDTIVVVGNLRALPVEGVGSVFGFDKPLTEIPRSASTISSEQLERFGAIEIYDLVAQSPGTFTNSFFGVGGALDIRGQPGETYFRGVRRLDNPGNYPTPIGASDRIDIVRGPASPIYGPSKSGGYMNFVPKSTRIAGGKFLDEPEGVVTYTTGSWDKNVLSANILGPGTIGGQEFGYNLYAEIEDSGSYYNNIFTKQTILQSSFETQLTDTVRLEFGGMYHDFKGVQNGGWNRLTQELVDNGTYITGNAQPLDTDGDGQLSTDEFDAAGGPDIFNSFGTFACDSPGVFPDGLTDACLIANYPQLALTDVGTATLDRRNTLTGPNDKLNNKMTTLYFDVIYEGTNGWNIKNQFFYEGYENLNENAYGFSQFHDSWVIENKIVIEKEFEFSGVTINSQLSPSIRYTDFAHGDDFYYEYFHRVDLTKGYDARSDRLLSTECNCEFSNYVVGNYLNYGIASLFDVDFDFGLNLVLGARYDFLDAESEQVDQFLDSSHPFFDPRDGADEDEGFSYNVSVSYDLPGGLRPYVTVSEQAVVIAGQGAEIYPGDLIGGSWITATELREAGVKGEFLNGKLFMAVAYYEQERIDKNVQSTTVNQAIKTEGWEAEARWAVSDNFLVTASYTNIIVINESFLQNGVTFSFWGAEDLVNLSDPSLIYGGQPGGLVLTNTEDTAARAGIPENIYSLTGTYSFDNGVSLAGTLVSADEAFSGQSQVVTLPAYTLVDLSASYEFDNWLLRLVVKNATDEEYFRANFTELFGSTIALPERPRSVQGSVIYKF